MGGGGGTYTENFNQISKNTMARSIIVCASTGSRSRSQNMLMLFCPFLYVTARKLICADNNPHKIQFSQSQCLARLTDHWVNCYRGCYRAIPFNIPPPPPIDDVF